MQSQVKEILKKKEFTRENIISLLGSQGEERTLLFKKSAEIRDRYIGKNVWFRGLIEFSNICSKDCLYCGIRKGNKNLTRYNLTDEEILVAARFAFENKYGSVALQSGEMESDYFSERIENLLHKIKNMSAGKLGITLSVGEQEPEVYSRWYNAGAHRYLLRIESTNRSLYKKIHPDNNLHDFNRRLGCLKNL